MITAETTATAPAIAELDRGPELALALADVRSGELLVLIGGRELAPGGFDRARQARRQPGSTFKPAVYGAALRSRRFNPASTAHGGALAQGRALRLREGLAQSDNAVALALMRDMGPEAVHAFAKDLGIEAELGPHLSLALGTSELPPIELLTAYLTLARGGVGIEPRAILDIEVSDGLHGERPEARPAPRPRLFGVDAELAALLTDMLTSVVQEGTAKAAKALERPVAGKTGTTNEARDAWFAGYTPDLAAVTWVGFDTPRSLGARESGSSIALPIWLAAMDRASAELPITGFSLPETLVRATIDEDTGGPACRERRTWTDPERCTQGWWFTDCTPAQTRAVPPYQRCVSPTRWRDEWFLPGTEPERPPQPIGEGFRDLDADPGASPPTPRARARVLSFSLFSTSPSRDDASTERLEQRLGALEAEIDEMWRHALERDARQRLGDWGQPQPPPGTRLVLRLRVSPQGESTQLELTRSSADPLLDAWAEAAVQQALAASAFSPPPTTLEPHSREAELSIELLVGAGEPQAR